MTQISPPGLPIPNRRRKSPTATCSCGLLCGRPRSHSGRSLQRGSDRPLPVSPWYPWRCRFHGSQNVSWHPHFLLVPVQKYSSLHTPPKWFQLEPERCEARKSNPSKTSSELAFGLRFAQIPSCTNHFNHHLMKGETSCPETKIPCRKGILSITR